MSQDPIDKARTLLWDMFALFLVVLIFLFYVALLTYSPLDTAFNSTYFPPKEPGNLAGTLGAMWSASSLYFLGIASYLLPIPILLIIFHHFKRNITFKYGLAYVLSFLCFYLGTLYVLFIYIPVIHIQDFDLSSLGKVGMWIHSHIYLQRGDLGSLLISLSALVLALIIGNFSKLKTISQNVIKKK